MTQLTMNDAWCEALFASELQRSDAPALDALVGVIRRTVRRFGITGCAGRMAQEFGDHPEAAASRMRWIRQLITEMPASGRLTDHQPSSRPTPGSGSRATQPATGSAHRAA